MISQFLSRKLQNLRCWWKAPTTCRDRLLGAIIGGMGCFWIGVLGRLLLGSMPVPLSTVAWWAFGSAVSGMVLGFLFPKTVSVVCFPFATFGGGIGS